MSSSSFSLSSSSLSLSSLSSSLPNAIPLLAHPNTSQVNRTESVWESILGEDFQESSPHRAASVAPRDDITLMTRETPSLHAAAAEGNPEAIRRLLATGGVDINARNDDNHTPLHLAAFSGNAEAVRTLLDAGADINARNDDGCTPLHLATLFGNREAIRTLLAAEADVNARNDLGYTPADMMDFKLPDCILQALNGDQF